ncbi:MAG: hypothetical protein H6573_21500 [Lewinellaceae bacterium]|nr:hypothetical protein [Phaeodactylibacter sp.]MCB9350057.1 hypothetical protein [Lewinellaceae bacterium]
MTGVSSWWNDYLLHLTRSVPIFESRMQFFAFDIDPGLLFECSSPGQAV